MPQFSVGLKCQCGKIYVSAMGYVLHKAVCSHYAPPQNASRFYAKCKVCIVFATRTSRAHLKTSLSSSGLNSLVNAWLRAIRGCFWIHHTKHIKWDPSVVSLRWHNARERPFIYKATSSRFGVMRSRCVLMWWPCQVFWSNCSNTSFN